MIYIKVFIFFQPLLTKEAEVIQLSDEDMDVKPPRLSPQKRSMPSSLQMPPSKKAPDNNGNVQIPNKNLANDAEKPGHVLGNMEQEVKDLLNGTVRNLKPSAVGQLTTKATTKSKQSEFTARVVGLSLPDTTHLNRGWTEHPVIAMGREEVNARFQDMPFGQESEKRMGIPPPAQVSKALTPTAACTLQGTEMHRLPHNMRGDLPQGAKIESIENKSKLPKQVEDETAGLTWGMVRNFFNFSNW